MLNAEKPMNKFLSIMAAAALCSSFAVSPAYATDAGDMQKKATMQSEMMQKKDGMMQKKDGMMQKKDGMMQKKDDMMQKKDGKM